MDNLTPAFVNEQMKMAQAAERIMPNQLPFWRNIYTLHCKQSRGQSPTTKKIYVEGGFSVVKAYCEEWCHQMGYQFLLLVPEFSDLEFELRREIASPKNQIVNGE